MTLTPQEIADGWIPHDGKGRPHPPATRVESKRRDGRIETGVSVFMLWPHYGDGDDIIAYRLADTGEVSEAALWKAHDERTPPPEPNTSAEPVGDGGMREVVARIIDPAAFLFSTDELPKGNTAQYQALRKADRILTALRPAQAPEGLDVVAWRFKFPEDNRWKYSQIDPIAYATNVSPLTDHATATRLLDEKDARIAVLEKAFAAAQNADAEATAYLRSVIDREQATARKFHDRALAAEARIAELEAERDAALRECSKWATEAGLAKGKLETSELAGVVDGWRARALAAEAEVERLRDPVAVHANMLRGTIAKPTPAQIAHLYRGDEAAEIVSEIAREALAGGQVDA